ncbi:hypothetical protein ABPG75_003890 [Micractinium tetrahymenae]
MTGELPPLGTARVFWLGSHQAHQVAGRPFHSPLSKLHAEGLALLQQHGWQRTSCDDERNPGFAWTTRKGADFPASASQPGLPAVRQLPQRCTAVLDDKCLLAQCLAAEGCTSLMPGTWTDIDAFAAEHAAKGGGTEGGDNAGGSGMAAAGRLFFLKHRHGVKGQSVYPFASLPALLERLAGMQGSHTRRQFLVQAGVEPPLLLRGGRKATLRAHVLVLLDHGRQVQQAQQVQHAQQLQAGQARQTEQSLEGMQRQAQGRQQQQQDVASPQAGADCLHQEAAEQGHHQQQQHTQGDALRQQRAAPPPLQQQEQTAQSQPTLQAYVHEDIIVQEHARPLQPLAAGTGAGGATGHVAPESAGVQAEEAGAEAADRAAETGRPLRPPYGGQADDWVHVSSRGRGHPPPYLLSQLEEQLAGASQRQVEEQGRSPRCLCSRARSAWLQTQPLARQRSTRRRHLPCRCCYWRPTATAPLPAAP